MSGPLCLAIAGAGAIGRAHAQRVRVQPGCELLGFADPSPAAAAFAAELGVAHWADLDALFDAAPDDARPDGVIIATPNRLHVPGALACIARGIPALVEKPVADELDAAWRLVDAVERAGVPVLVGHHRRYSAVLECARAAIVSGALGALVAVQGAALFRKPARYFEEAAWRRERGGGPILINMVHEIDDLRLLAGEIVEVHALVSSARRGFEVEDTASIGLRFANGALGSFVLSDAAASTRSWEQTSGENAAYARDPGEACYLIAGERGSVAVPSLRLQTALGAASWVEPMRVETLAVDAGVDPLQRQLAAFCVVIRGSAAPRVGVRDATLSLQVTLAIAQAAASGRPVRCDNSAN